MTSFMMIIIIIIIIVVVVKRIDIDEKGSNFSFFAQMGLTKLPKKCSSYDLILI